MTRRKRNDYRITPRFTVDLARGAVVRQESVWFPAWHYRSWARWFSKASALSDLPRGRMWNELESHRALLVASAVSWSVAYVEASSNELLAVIAEGTEHARRRPSISASASEFCRALLSDRVTWTSQDVVWNVATVLAVLGRQRLDPGASPTQDVVLLREFRNQLIHAQVELVVHRASEGQLPGVERPPLSARVLQRVEGQASPRARTARQPIDALVPSVAAWAVRSAEQYVQDFVRRSGVKLRSSPAGKH